MKPRICLLEDDSIMGEALAERFDIEGYDCDWYQRGREALGPLTHKRYDLVVSGMLVVGAIGIVLDLAIRRLERFDEVRWGYARG